MELNRAKAETEAKPIANFNSYAAVMAFHACSKYLRRKNPVRGQLKDRLRYLLTSRPQLSLLSAYGIELYCRQRLAALELLEAASP